MGSLNNKAFVNQAVLRAFDIGTAPAADQFDLDPEDLADYQRRFIKHQYEQMFADLDATATGGVKLHWLGRMRQNPWFELFFKIIVAVGLIVLCWAMPSLLQPLVDPLTNTVVWLGFTSLYLVTFIGLGIEVIFWVQHHVNFDFLNPLTRTGTFDYATLIRSDQLSAYEKCRLNQQKYLAYLVAFCVVIIALASLTGGGGN